MIRDHLELISRVLKALYLLVADFVPLVLRSRLIKRTDHCLASTLQRNIFSQKFSENWHQPFWFRQSFGIYVGNALPLYAHRESGIVIAGRQTSERYMDIKHIYQISLSLTVSSR